MDSPLSDYPGYFPPRKPPFWSRPKVGVAAGIVGIILGSAFAAGGEAEAPAQAAPRVVEDSTSAIAEAVEDATDELSDELAEADATHAKELSDELAEADATHAKELRIAGKQAAKHERAAVKAAVTKAVAAAVAKTRAEEQAKAAESQIQTLTSTPPSGGRTDPHYGTCGEANDNGFGSYVRGQDPEYEWYDDRDNDGVVCEF